MARATVAGIPLHPMLNDMPAALLTTSALSDMMSLFTGSNSWAHCAYRTLQVGTISAVGAAAAGLMDYQDVPSDPEAQQAGRLHLLLNTGILATSVVNLMLRDSRHPRGGFLGMLLSLTSLMALLYSGLQGATLAYKHRMALPSGASAQPMRQMQEGAQQVV